MKKDTPWLTLSESDRYMRVRSGTTRQLIANGLIGCYKPSNTMLVDRRELDSFIKSRKAELANVVCAP